MRTSRFLNAALCTGSFLAFSAAPALAQVAPPAPAPVAAPSGVTFAPVIMQSGTVTYTTGVDVNVAQAAPPPAAPSFRGGGMSGPGMGMMGGDPGEMFNRFSKGKDVIRRDDLEGFAVMIFDRMARDNGITNGQITREQFMDVSKKAQERFQGMRNGGDMGGGRGGFGGGGPGGFGGGGGGGNMSQEDRDKYAERRFAEMNVSKSGKLSDSEMNDRMRAAKDKIDTNKDGYIDLNEYKAYVNERFTQMSGGPASAEPAKPAETPAAAPAVAAPVASATDDDTPAKPVVYRAGKLPPGLPAWFAQLDTDNDGQVGLYEWVKGGKAVDEFRTMDRNDDGFITAEELLSFVNNGHKPTSTATLAMGNGDQGGFGGRGRGGDFGGGRGGQGRGGMGMGMGMGGDNGGSRGGPGRGGMGMGMGDMTRGGPGGGRGGLGGGRGGDTGNTDTGMRGGRGGRGELPVAAATPSTETPAVSTDRGPGGRGRDNGGGRGMGRGPGGNNGPTADPAATGERPRGKGRGNGGNNNP